MSRLELDDVGARQTSQLVGILALVVSAIDIVAVIARMVLEPTLMVQDLPVAGFASHTAVSFP